MDTGVVIFFSNLWSVISNATRESFNTLLKWYNTTINYLMSLFQTIMANPIIAIIVIIIILISIVWFPWHHIFLAGIQSVYTCMYRPLVSQVVLPVAEAIAPVVEKVMEWWNFFWRIQSVYISDILMIPLRCKGTPELWDVLMHSFTPLANAIMLLLQSVIDALMGISVNHERSLITAGLVGDVGTNITAAASGVVSCYCSILAYPVDAIVLSMADSHFQCIIANVLSTVLETLSQLLRVIYHWLKYTLDVIMWVINRILTLIQNTESISFPKFDGWYLTIDLTNVVNYIEAFACCLGDFVDDVLNSVVYIAGKSACVSSHNVTAVDGWVDPDGCDINVVEDPWRCNCSIPVGQVHPFKLGGLIRSFIPPITETIYIPYRFFQNWITYGITFAWKNLDEQRLLDTFEAVCIESSTAIWSIGDGLNGVVLAISRKNDTWFKPGTVLNALFSYSAYYNHTCRSSISFTRSMVRLLRELPTYAEYQDGKYFDCYLHALNDVGNSVADLINDFTGSIPDIYSCTIVYVPEDNIDKLVCNDKMFGNAVGDIVSVIPRTIAALYNYIITVSERASTFTQARHVPTDDIFDELLHGVDALNKFQHAIIKFSMPLSNVRFTLPKTTISISGDDFVAQHYMIDSISGWNKLFIEIPRFLMRSIHHGNFNDWEFQRADIEHLIRSEYDAIMAWSTLETRAQCVLYNNNPNHTCYWEINLGGPSGSGVCPLNLMPCMREPKAHLYNALAQLINSIPEAIFFPFEFADTFFDKAACELENAAADLEVALGGINNITVNISSSWGTAGDINIGKGVAFMASGIVQVTRQVNGLLVDTIRAYREYPSAVADAACELQHPDMMNPFTNNNGNTCHECNEYNILWPGEYENADEACQRHFSNQRLKCCPSSGRCSLFCRAPDMVITDMTHAIQTFAFGVKQVADSFAVVEPQLGSGVYHLGKGILHMYSTVVRGTVGTIARLLAGEMYKPYEEPDGDDIPGVCDIVNDNRMSTVLADASCIIDEVGYAMGSFTSVPVSLIGRGIGLIGRLVDPNTDNEPRTTDKIEKGTLTLSRAWMQFIGSLFEMFGEYLGFLYRILGAVLDGQIFMKDGGSELWCKIVNDGVCSFENATDKSREAIRHLFANIDIFEGGYTCELADFAEATFGIVAVPLKQIARVIAMIACPDSVDLGARFSIDEIFKAGRRFCASAGNLISGVIYSTIRIFTASVEHSVKFKSILNIIGTIIGTCLNVIISIVHSILLISLWVLQSIFTAIDQWIDGIPSDLFACIRPFGQSLEACLRAISVLMTYIWKVFGSIVNLFADFIHLLIVDENSGVADFVSSLVRIFTSGISWIFSLFSFNNSNIKLATSAFIDAIFDFIVSIFDDLYLFIVRVIDGLLFPNVLIAGEYGLIECFAVFPVCVWDIIFGRDVDVRMTLIPSSNTPKGNPNNPYDIYNTAERLMIFSFSFDQNDDCFTILNTSAEMLFAVNKEECEMINNISHTMDPFLCVKDMNMGSRTIQRMKIVWCVKQMLESPSSRYNPKFRSRSANEINRFPTRSKLKRNNDITYKCIDSDGYWITNNTICIMQIMENATDVIYASIVAISKAVVKDTNDAYTSYSTYLLESGVDPVLAVYYDQMLHQYIEYGAYSFEEFRTKMIKFSLNGNETQSVRVSYLLAHSVDLIFNASVQILADLNEDVGEASSSTTNEDYLTTTGDFTIMSPGKSLSAEKPSIALQRLETEFGAIVPLERWQRRAMNSPGLPWATDQSMIRWGGTGDLSKWCGHDMTPWHVAFGQYALTDSVDTAAGPYNFTGDPDDYSDYYPDLVETCPDWCPDCFKATMTRTMVKFPCPAYKCDNIASSSALNRLCGRICGTASTSLEFTFACHWDTNRVSATWVSNTNQYFTDGSYGGLNSALYQTFKTKYTKLVRKYPGITSQTIYLFMLPGFRSADYNAYTHTSWVKSMHAGLGETDTECTTIGTTGWASDSWCDEKCYPNSYLFPGKKRSFIEELIIARNDAMRCISSYTDAPCSSNASMQKHWKYLFERDQDVSQPDRVYPHLSLSIFVTDPDEIAYSRIQSIDSVLRFVTDMCGKFCAVKDKYCERMPRSLQCHESPISQVACMTSCDLDWTNAAGSNVVPPKQCSNRASMTCSAWDPINPPQYNTTCKCPAIISNDTGMCNSTYSCSYVFGTRGKISENALPFFCPLTAREPVNSFWPFNYTVASNSIPIDVKTFGNITLVPTKTVKTSDYILLKSEIYDRSGIPSVTGTICKYNKEYKEYLNVHNTVHYDSLFRPLNNPASETSVLNTILKTAFAQYTVGNAYSRLTLLNENGINDNQYCHWINCRDDDEHHLYVFPSQNCISRDNLDILYNPTIDYGINTETIIFNELVRKISSPFNITATFSINAKGNMCPSNILDLFPELLNGICDSSSGKCFQNATWTNPQPLHSCDRNVYCSDFKSMSMTCVATTNQILTVNVTGHSSGAYIYTRNDTKTSTTTRLIKACSGYYSLDSLPENFNVSKPQNMLCPDMPILRIDLGDKLCNNVKSDTSITGCSRYHWENCADDVDDNVEMWIYNTGVTCSNKAYQADEGIANNATEGIITLGEFTQHLISDNLNVGIASTTFTGKQPGEHTVTVSGTNDFCDNLCPVSSDPWCVGLLNGSGIDCDVYRNIPNATNRIAARKMFCNLFPSRIRYINSSMFPISGTGSMVNNAGTKTIISDMPLNAVMCPTNDGRWGTQVHVSSANPTLYPPYSSDGCVMRGPSIPMGAEPTEQDCRDISDYADYVQSVYTWIQHGAPTSWNQFTRDYDDDKTHNMSILIQTQKIGTKTREEIKEMLIDKVAETRSRNLKSHMLYAGIDTKTEYGALLFKRVIESQWCIDAGAVHQRRCEICMTDHPIQCDRYPDPKYRESEHLPLRICNYTDLEYPCIRVIPFTMIPDNPVDAYFDFVTRTRKFNLENPYDELIKHTLSFKKLIRQLTNRQKQKTSIDDNIITVSEKMMLFSMARTLELAACSAVPGSAACTRLDDAVDQQKNNARHTVFKFSKDVPMVSKSRGSRNMQEMLIRADTLERRWDVVIPPLDQMRRDCYLVCGYDFWDLLERSCFWQAADPDGPFYDVVDTLLDTRQWVCERIAPTNGSEYFVDGGGIIAFNGSLIKFRPSTVTSATWGDSNGILYDFKKAVLNIAGLIIGIHPTTFTVSEFFSAIGAKFFGINDTSSFNNDTMTWVTNFNIDKRKGDLGLYYWATMFLPPPLAQVGMTCDKLNGTNKVFGIIPFWNPFWTLNWPPYMPTWAPNATVDLLKLSVKYNYIVPDRMVLTPDGCRRNASSMVCLPFTKICKCSPEFYNCAEITGMSGAFDLFFFAFNWILPNVAQSRLGKMFAWTFLMKDKNALYANITSNDNFNDYLYCFIVTSPGLFWTLSVSSFAWTAITALVEFIVAWIYVWASVFFGLVIFLWNRERDIDTTDSINHVKRLKNQDDDINETIELNKLIRGNKFIMDKLQTSSTNESHPSIRRRNNASTSSFD